MWNLKLSSAVLITMMLWTRQWNDDTKHPSEVFSSVFLYLSRINCSYFQNMIWNKTWTLLTIPTYSLSTYTHKIHSGPFPTNAIRRLAVTYHMVDVVANDTYPTVVAKILDEIQNLADVTVCVITLTVYMS